MDVDGAGTVLRGDASVTTSAEALEEGDFAPPR